MMLDFSWKYFTMTGDIDAYLLYKQMSEKYVTDKVETNDQEQTFEEDSSLES